MTDDPRSGPGADRPLWGTRRGPAPDDVAGAPPDAAPPTSPAWPPPAPPSDAAPPTSPAWPPPAPPSDPAPPTSPAWPPAGPPPPPGIPYETAPAPPPARRSRVPLVVGAVGLVAVLVVLGVVAVRVLRPVDVSGTVGQTGSETAAVAPPDPTPPDDGPARAPSAAAGCISAPSQDAAGAAVTYDPGQVLDGRPDTAWRCDGDGVGQQIRVDLGRRVTLTGVGIVPGYAKTDPADQADRYAQNRRISRVRYTFDGGAAVEQELDTDPSDRAAQTLTLTGVTTTSVTVTVLASVPGQQVGPYPPSDKIAISELEVLAA